MDKRVTVGISYPIYLFSIYLMSMTINIKLCHHDINLKSIILRLYSPVEAFELIKCKRLAIQTPHVQNHIRWTAQGGVLLTGCCNCDILQGGLFVYSTYSSYIAQYIEQWVSLGLDFPANGRPVYPSTQITLKQHLLYLPRPRSGEKPTAKIHLFWLANQLFTSSSSLSLSPVDPHLVQDRLNWGSSVVFAHSLHSPISNMYPWTSPANAYNHRALVGWWHLFLPWIATPPSHSHFISAILGSLVGSGISLSSVLGYIHSPKAYFMLISKIHIINVNKSTSK